MDVYFIKGLVEKREERRGKGEERRGKREI
jgi:hypothetical protein